jgi:hypothetical protein
MDYYDGSMTHATYFWVLMNTNMGSFLECGYGSNVGMGGSTLTPKIPQNPNLINHNLYGVEISAFFF